MSDIEKELDEILNEFLIWHWNEFKTGKFEKLGHIPFSGKQQEIARSKLLSMLREARAKGRSTYLRRMYIAGFINKSELVVMLRPHRLNQELKDFTEKELKELSTAEKGASDE